MYSHSEAIWHTPIRLIFLLDLTGYNAPRWDNDARTKHYYKNVNLSRLGNSCCPGFPTRNASLGQKGCPFVPGLATGTKGAASAHVAGAPFCSGWCYQPGQNVLFFMFSFSQFFFYFNYTFAFQLNLCIGIQCVWSPLIYTCIYIVTYIIFVLDSFHI